MAPSSAARRMPPPSDCLLNRFVHTDYTQYNTAAAAAEDDRDLIITLEEQPRLILRCVDREAAPARAYGQDEADDLLRGMEIGIYRSAAPLSLSCLSIPRCTVGTYILAVDRNVMVLVSSSQDGLHCYFVYDSVQGSLRMIPLPEHRSFRPAVTNRVLIARRHGHGESSSSSYALVLPQKLTMDDVGRERDVLSIWRPGPSSSSSSSEMTNPRPSWSEVKEARFPELVHGRGYKADVVFSCDGYAYWADLLRGAMYCSCKDILDDDNNNGAAVVECGFIHLPPTSNLKGGSCSARQGRSCRVSGTEAYRAMGVAGHGQDSVVTFVSINGFHEHVDLKDRTVTVWRLPAGQGQLHGCWDMEHQLRLETLWGLDGFGGLPKDLTPMFPMLRKGDKDVLYVALGEYRENLYNWKFITGDPRYLLAVDLRNKVVLGATRLTEWYGSVHGLISCDFNKFIRPVALVEGARKSKMMQEEAY